MWYSRAERARARDVLQPPGGVREPSGVDARNVRCLTLGALPVVPVGGPEGGGRCPERPLAVSRGERRPDAGQAREAPHGRQAGQPRGGAATRAGRRPERCPARGVKARRRRVVSSAGQASVRPLERPLDDPGDAAVTGTREGDPSVAGTDLLERVLDPQHLRRALHQVRRPPGAPGIDGMTVDDLGADVTIPWPTIRAAWLGGTYAPQPVRRTAIPPSGGGTRTLGLPPVLDRCSEPARVHVLPAAWAPPGSAGSSGFRPPRSAPQAVGPAQASSRAGDPGVVDRDREPCFARVTHDVVMRRVRRRVKDRRVVRRSHRCRNAGGLTLERGVEPTAEGPPPGGPLSPRLATRRRAARAKALETRGPRCARSADAAHLSVRSRPAGARGMARVRRVLERTLRLQVHAAKSAVARPWNRQGLGGTFTRRQPNRRQVRAKALPACQAQGRALTGRTRGRTIRPSVPALRQLILGGRAFFGVAGDALHGATWSRGAGGGCGATTGSQGAASGTGRCERAAWAGRGLGIRSSQPMARGVCGSAPRWRCRSAPSPREACPACVRVAPPLKPPNRRRRDPSGRWCGRAGAVRLPLSRLL